MSISSKPRTERSARETLIAFGVDPDSVTLPTEPSSRRYTHDWLLDVATIEAFAQLDYDAVSW